ncbi:hypothetical protein MRB53_029950 [Persea americana]|uniref:Uncharacterized protein n=1 Tax=Persea americana TaxID=3435 RepID=A0ACC2KJZ0_PERAE|nr:hypothetical protein MRB53_029950 [Persea americana]
MDSSASRASVFAAQVFGVTAFVLMLVWLLHFRGGLNLNSQNKDLIFNVHPFLMFLGFIFIGGQATMVYMTVRAERKVQKFIHMILHLIAITLGIIGIYAVFKFHNESGISNMNSLHSWLGIITFCLYGLQVTLFCCVFVMLLNILTLPSRIGYSWKIVPIRQSELPDQRPRNGPVGSNDDTQWEHFSCTGSNDDTNGNILAARSGSSNHVICCCGQHFSDK